jgi:hypothetical protein
MPNDTLATDSTVAKTTRRSHFVAQFYLRNFAEPIFSSNLCVYDIEKQRWDNRTPRGVGWFPHLYAMFDESGSRTDRFEKFLSQQIEDPAASALNRLATGETLESSGRSAIALFIALTAARSPEMMDDVVKTHIEKLAYAEREELDQLVKLWCGVARLPFDAKLHNEFLKPSTFGALLFWSVNLQRQLLEWNWHLVQTTREQPFVTTDRPVFLQWDQEHDVRLVSFPVSSELALIIVGGGQFDEARDRTKETWLINRQTMDRAKRFVVCCKQDFPAADLMPNLGTRA